MLTMTCIVRRVLLQQPEVCIRSRLHVRAVTAHVRQRIRIVKKKANHGPMRVQAIIAQAVRRNARARPAAEAVLDGANNVLQEQNIAIRKVNLALNRENIKH